MGWGDALIEIDYSARRLEAGLELDRLEPVAEAATSRPEKQPLGRRLAWKMGDAMAGLWCWWERHAVSERGAAAC
jgi:hypothetical protein